MWQNMTKYTLNKPKEGQAFQRDTLMTGRSMVVKEQLESQENREQFHQIESDSIIS
jgi:hypothetical protein